MIDSQVSENIKELLKDIKKFFNKLGYFDNATILEYLSFLFLVKSQGEWETLRVEIGNKKMDSSGEQKIQLSDLWDFPKTWLDNEPLDVSLMPLAEIDIPIFDLQGMMELLDLMFEYELSLGYLYDEYIVVAFGGVASAGRYATPRHLTSFMSSITQINSNDSLADFACGTGGMLVANSKVKKATGIEISPNMARLAFTNLILHGQMEYDLYIGNTFYLASNNESFRKARFDAILMNPPFGMSIETFLVEQTFGGEYTGRSETLFASLAYEKLNPGGRMTVLVPSGVLFSNGTGEKILREMLVEEGALVAVISLPQDSMQPVNNLAIHILFAVKTKNDEPGNNGVWFYRPRYDGLTSGHNRQLDPKNNDLPLIQAACSLTYQTNSFVQVDPLFDNNNLVGYRVKCRDGYNIKLQDLLNGNYYIEVFKSENIVEFIYLKEGKVFRGAPDLETVEIELIGEGELSGEYSLVKEMDAMDDEGLRYTISTDGFIGEIRKGKKGRVKFDWKSEDKFYESIICDSDGSPSQKLDIKFDLTKNDNKISAFKIVETDDYHSADKLFVFSEGIKAYPLTNSSGEKVYLFPPQATQGAIIVYDLLEGVLNHRPFMSFKSNYALLYREGQLFKTNEEKRGVTVDLSGNVLGLLISNISIAANKFLLQWEKYWEKEPVLVKTRTSAEILGDIKRKQNKLTITLDRLLSISEVQPVAGSELPPRLQLIEPPTGMLQDIQQSIWEIVQKQSEQAGDHLTPVPFQADDIHAKLKENISVMDVQRTLELFERMGLIVSVSYENVPYYRLPEERDLVKGDAA